MNLKRALRTDSPVKIAFVGAGGKTTAMFQLARLLRSPVAVTTTTHLGVWQLELADRHISVSRPEDIDQNAGLLEGVTVFTGAPSGDRRVRGPDALSLDRLAGFSEELGFSILVEADGSRQRPLKAPAANEPVIPGWIDHVVICQGLSAAGKVLDENVVFRPEVFSQLSGIGPGQTITLDGILRVLLDGQGGLKGIPEKACVTALLNQVSEGQVESTLMRVANIGCNTINSFIISNLDTQAIHACVEQSAGIMLAAGGSSRYGAPKLLLDWYGKPLLRHSVETALAGGLHPMIVVLGAVNDPARQALEGLPVDIVENPDWAEGQSTSLRAGLQELEKHSGQSYRVGSAVFLLADQPFTTPDLIRSLVMRHHITLAPVIAPYVDGKRGNPVLFDRDVFADLRLLQGDTGGRSIMNRYGIEAVEWRDPHILLDIDSPEDYRRLQDLE